MTVKVWFDCVLKYSGTMQSNDAWDRDLPYWLGHLYTVRSRIFIQESISDADAANITNFLKYGA